MSALNALLDVCLKHMRAARDRRRSVGSKLKRWERDIEDAALLADAEREERLSVVSVDLAEYTDMHPRKREGYVYDELMGKLHEQCPELHAAHFSDDAVEMRCEEEGY